MAQTVSDFLVMRLREWGVSRLFGYSGDGINGVMAALRRAEGNPRLIQPRHEELAAFMASAHAKYTGECGVCVATSGPGAVHLLNGLYDAKKDHVPAFAIVGQQARMSLGTDFQQELDLASLYKDVAGAYVHLVTDPPQARHLIDSALRIAIAERTVTALILPNDIQSAEYHDPPRSHGAVFSGPGYRAPCCLPYDQDLDAAAAVLDAGERVAILAGSGARGADAELTEIADKLGAGVGKAILGKDVLADDLPFVTGSVGLLGSEPSDDMMSHCDTLLLVGTRFPYSEFLPAPGQARSVQIDLDPMALSLRYPAEVNLHGDARATLAALCQRIQRKEKRDWREKIEANVRDWWQQLDNSAEVSADPINPQAVFHALNKRLPDDVMLACDVGTATNWYARYIQIKPGMRGSVSGGQASMGNAVPYLTAAKFAYPKRPGVAMVGDGAMQMLGNMGLITIAKYWREWDNPCAIMLVLNNRDLAQVSWEQRVMEGNPKFATSQDLPDFAYDDYAKLLGLEGLRMSGPEDIAPVWDAAFAAERPVVINAYTDPEVPPLPPHIPFEQAKNYLASMTGGDPDAWHAVKQSMKAMTSNWRNKD